MSDFEGKLERERARQRAKSNQIRLDAKAYREHMKSCNSVVIDSQLQHHKQHILILQEQLKEERIDANEMAKENRLLREEIESLENKLEMERFNTRSLKKDFEIQKELLLAVEQVQQEQPSVRRSKRLKK